VNILSTRARSRATDIAAVFLSSLAALALSLLAARLFDSWENAGIDLRMRWRHRLMRRPERVVGPDVVFIGIDAATQQSMGRYGAGDWLSRKPYYDQLALFQQYFRPSVLAYDIVFQEMLPESHRGRISESGERIGHIIDSLAEISQDAREILSDRILYDMNRLATEQGDTFLAHRFAAIAETDRFPVVAAYNFRGGSVDPQVVHIPRWTDEDVFGHDPDGDEEQGRRVPYLKDMAIPNADVHFPDERSRDDYGYSPNANLPSRELLDYTLLGFINGRPDADSVVRRLPLVVGFEYSNSVARTSSRVFTPSLALASSILHLGIDFPLPPGVVEVHFGDKIVLHAPVGRRIDIPIDEQGRIYLNFRGTIEDFREISFAEVAPSLHDTPPDERMRYAATHRLNIDGRVTVVGVNVTAVDAGACPVSARTPLVLAHLTAIDNILQEDFLCCLNPWESAAVAAVLALLFTPVCMAAKAQRLGLAFLAFAVGYFAIAYGSVHANIVVLPLISPLLYVGFCSFTVLTYRFLTEERAKRRIRNMFSTMVSGKVLRYLEENPESFSLRGHNVEATVFFSDVADFTGIAERLPPERITELLNAYLTPITDNIVRHEGYVDKYIGDGVVAVWGAPYPIEDHAFMACRSALEQQHLVEKLNARMAREYDANLAVRIGINSGIVTAGNMGSERKFQYTVMGDVVNLAARLEPTNKDFGTGIIIGQSTHEMVRDRVVARPLGRILVVGKREAVSVYELLGLSGHVDGLKLQIAEIYQDALGHFLNKRWDSCLGALDELLAIAPDGPAMHLRRRTQYFQAHPPPEDWQGEYVRAEKH